MHLAVWSLASASSFASLSLGLCVGSGGPAKRFRSSAAATAATGDAATTPSRRVFCDLDGVLCDFEAGVVKTTGLRVEEFMSIGTMWSELARAEPGFYSSLDWMSDGRDLWAAIAVLEPTILTGLPRGKWASPQKITWCARELGPDVPVITCMARDKHKHGGAGDVLIDDRIKAKEPWEDMGGLFVHHQTTEQTLRELQRLSLLPG